MTQEHAKEVFDLIIRDRLDLMPIEELVKLRAIGQGLVSWHKEKLKMMTALGVAEEDKKSWLESGQKAGRVLLDIEARIGELLDDLPKTEDVQRGDHLVSYTKPGELEKVGFSRKDRHKADNARAIARHPEAVAEVIQEAEENEDIPTKTAVLNKIRYEKEKERKAQAPPKSTIDLVGDELIYKNKLIQVINILPNEPPRDLTEEGYTQINALWQIIYKRGEQFNGKNETVSTDRCAGFIKE